MEKSLLEVSERRDQVSSAFTITQTQHVHSRGRSPRCWRTSVATSKSSCQVSGNVERKMYARLLFFSRALRLAERPSDARFSSNPRAASLASAARFSQSLGPPRRPFYRSRNPYRIRHNPTGGRKLKQPKPKQPKPGLEPRASSADRQPWASAAAAARAAAAA